MNEPTPTAPPPKPTSLKQMYDAKKPYPKFQVAFEDAVSGPELVKIQMEAINAMSLYVQLVAFVPMLRHMGVTRFWVINPDGTALEADCNLDAIGSALQRLFGQRIVLATEDMMGQFRKPQ